MKLFNHIGVKAAAVLIAAGGLGFGMVGSGVHAAFTDAGHATENISVGTFGITLSSTQSGVTCDGVSQAWTCSYTFSGPIGSAAGTAPMAFVINQTGTIAGTYSVSAGAITQLPSGGTAFTDLGTPVTNGALAVGAHVTFNGGMQWAALVNGNEGQTVTEVYTITANA